MWSSDCITQEAHSLKPVGGSHPLFAIKSRNITEYVFKCFFKELKEYLHPIDYIYLVKLYGINPELIYKNETIKNTNLDIDFIDLKPN